MKRNSDKSLHIFDLDHTLLKRNSCYLFGSYLFRKCEISFPIAIYCLWYYWKASIGRLSLNKLHSLIFQRLFFGKKKAFFVSQLEAFFLENSSDLFYQPALQRLEEARLAGHYIAICSSAPDFIVEKISSLLKINDWCGSSYLVDKSGIFCLISHSVQGMEKAEYVLSLQSKYSVKKRRVVAYSDSICDLKFLQAAGRSVAVQPDKKLIQICKKMKWEII